MLPKLNAFRALRRISGGNLKYCRQNLLVTEEQSRPSFVDIPLRFLPKKIEPPRSRVRVDLTVPRVVEIDLTELGEELVFLFLVQAPNRINNFHDSAHDLGSYRQMNQM